MMDGPEAWLFNKSRRSEETYREKVVVKAATTNAGFFAGAPARPVADLNRVLIEALLLQIENHVRLEQAAAECSLESPNATLLHSRTISTLVN